MKRTLFAVVLLASLSVSSAQASETIVFRSGMVAGQPGTIPTQSGIGPVDDRVTYFTRAGCGQPLSTSAFTPADFAAASAGPPAELVVPHAFWIPDLPSDPDARWINWNHGNIGPSTGPSSGSARPAQSTLFAVDFVVASTGNIGATVDLWFAVDDRLGDETGPNPIGAYMNGVPLDDQFSGGFWPFESHAMQRGVPVRTGTNTLYLYQRDDACAVSGIIFSCRVTVAECGNVQPYCSSLPNSSGSVANIWTSGGVSVAANQMVLHATGGPPRASGMFIYSSQPAWLPFGDGILCISPMAPGIHRAGPMVVLDAFGAASQGLEFPALLGSGKIYGGSTWHFQLWFRDAVPGGAGFNLSDSIAVTFCP